VQWCRWCSGQRLSGVPLFYRACSEVVLGRQISGRGAKRSQRAAGTRCAPPGCRTRSRGRRPGGSAWRGRPTSPPPTRAPSEPVGPGRARACWGLGHESASLLHRACRQRQAWRGVPMARRTAWQSAPLVAALHVARSGLGGAHAVSVFARGRGRAARPGGGLAGAAAGSAVRRTLCGAVRAGGVRRHRRRLRAQQPRCARGVRRQRRRSALLCVACVVRAASPNYVTCTKQRAGVRGCTSGCALLP